MPVAIDQYRTISGGEEKKMEEMREGLGRSEKTNGGIWEFCFNEW